MEYIKRKLKEQLKMLLELSSKTNNIEEVCDLNREINRTTEILIQIQLTTF